MKPMLREANLNSLNVSFGLVRPKPDREKDGNMPDVDIGDVLKAKINSLIDSLFVPKTLPDANSIQGGKASTLRRIAKGLHEARRCRAKFLPKEFLGEPGWDILLQLYAIETPLSVKSVCLSVDAPYTTAWRWIAALEDQGFIDRRDDASDGRRVQLSLTVQGEKHIEIALKDIVKRLNELSALFAVVLEG